jgi:hypothetical protein
MVIHREWRYRLSASGLRPSGSGVAAVVVARPSLALCPEWTSGELWWGVGARFGGRGLDGVGDAARRVVPSPLRGLPCADLAGPRVQGGEVLAVVPRGLGAVVCSVPSVP